MRDNVRADREGEHRAAFRRNSKKIIMSQSICGICGKPVDKSLKYPNPMAASVDHIIPIARGGHPSEIDNLQLAHWCCNRAKSDKLMRNKGEEQATQTIVSNRNLPQTRDWSNYTSD